MSVYDLSCPNPSTVNPLQVSGFEFKIAKIPELSFWVKETTLPNISLPQASQETPFKTIPRIGDKPEFGALSLRFMVDSEMKNYAALYTWITLTSFPRYHGQVDEWRRRWFGAFNDQDTDNLLVSDATLTVKSINSKTAGCFIFNNLWISDLGGMTLSDEATETQYIYCDATFAFENFTFTSISS